MQNDDDSDSVWFAPSNNVMGIFVLFVIGLQLVFFHALGINYPLYLSFVLPKFTIPAVNLGLAGWNLLDLDDAFNGIK